MIKRISEVNEMEEKNEIKKNKFTILGISIWRIFTYFIIYSVLGYIIETVFGIITKGTWESRQSFLYGPFCSIYGLGAVVMILFLQYFKKNNNTLFWGGFLVGSITEYIVSFIGEKIFHVIWWDYSNMPLNINGRICVFFSLFWGLLAIYLITYVNPKIDRLINWIKSKLSIKVLKSITAVTIVFLFLNCLITGFAIEMFFIRKVHENNLPVIGKERIDSKYEEIYHNEQLSKIIYQFFGDKKMIRTFPNLKTQDCNGNMIYFDCYVGDIKPYYYKFQSNWRGDLVNILKQENREVEKDI